ncbi:hypothetical protein INR49_026636 [Caranx melampygus]|nr:hypothetical protein INR49_026636 [Caranx melampygus]
MMAEEEPEDGRGGGGEKEGGIGKREGEREKERERERPGEERKAVAAGKEQRRGDGVKVVSNTEWATLTQEGSRGCKLKRVMSWLQPPGRRKAQGLSGERGASVEALLKM